MTYPIREHVDEQDDALAAQLDQRSGLWTRLQLMEMDAAFCLQMRRAHPKREIVGAGAEDGVAAPPVLHRAALAKAEGTDDAVRAL